MITPNEAAKSVGKSKTTILRHIDKGKLSAARDDNGNWKIDPSELARVYGGGTGGAERVPAHGAPRSGTSGPVGPQNVPPEINVLEVKLEAAEKLAAERETELHHRDVTIGHLRDELADEKRERRETQTKLTALLTHQRESKPEPQPTTKPATPARINNYPLWVLVLAAFAFLIWFMATGQG